MKADATPNAGDLKDLYTIFKPEYRHLSPVHGALSWETPLIESMYRFDPHSLDEKTSSLNKFMRKLFYLNNDMINFNVMQSHTELATHITPFMVGQIMGAIERERATPEPVKRPENKAPKKESKHPVAAGSTRLAEALRTILAPAEKEAGAALDSAIASIDITVKREDKEYAALKATIDALKKSRTPIPIDDQKRFDNLTKPRTLMAIMKKKRSRLIADFAEYLQASLALSNGTDYVINTAHNVLLAFLWAICNNRNDLLEYLKGAVSITGKTLLEEASQNILSADAPESKQWVDQRFSEQEFDDGVHDLFEFSIPENLVQHIQNPEISALELLGFAFFKSLFPIELRYGRSTYKGVAFPDCGETFLRNLFNVLIYNPQKRIYNVPLLEDLTKGAKNAEKRTALINFYTKYMQAGSERLWSASDDWNVVVSEIPGIAYARAGNCEITALRNPTLGLKNMEKILDQLTGFENFEALIEGAQSLGIPLSDYIKSPADGRQQITLKLNGSSFQLQFFANHFEITYPPVTPSINHDELYDAIMKSEHLATSPQLIMWLAITCHQRLSETINKIHRILSPAQLNLFLFQLNLSDINQATSVIQAVLHKESPYAPAWSEKIIQLLYKNIPHDYHAQSTFFDSLVHPDAKDDVATSVLTKLMPQLTHESQIFAALEKIFNKKIERFYPWALSQLDSIKNLDYRETIITKLLDNDLAKNTAASTWINKVLPTLEREDGDKYGGVWSPQALVIAQIITKTAISPFQETIENLIPEIPAYAFHQILHALQPRIASETTAVVGILSRLAEVIPINQYDLLQKIANTIPDEAQQKNINAILHTRFGDR